MLAIIVTEIKMTIAGKYTKLTIISPDKITDIHWLEKHYDQILEELYFAANRIDEIIKTKNKYKK